MENPLRVSSASLKDCFGGKGYILSSIPFTILFGNPLILYVFASILPMHRKLMTFEETTTK